MWRNTQLLFIDTHILIHRLIDDDDNDDDDATAKKKDYIKDANSYIYKYMPMCGYTHTHMKRSTERADRRVLCNHHYSNIIYIVEY